MVFPTTISANNSSLISDVCTVATFFPLFNIVILSVISIISSNLWEINTTEIPSFFKFLTMANKFSTSFLGNAEVGSSRRINLQFPFKALAIAAICCWAILRRSILSFTLMSTLINLRSSFDTLSISFQSTMPALFLGIFPWQIFSATVRCGNRSSSWYTIRIPWLAAAWGESKDIFSPSIYILPVVGVSAPLIIFIKVDFPAPFSPRRPCISPGRISKSISDSTVIP